MNTLNDSAFMSSIDKILNAVEHSLFGDDLIPNREGECMYFEYLDCTINVGIKFVAKSLAECTLNYTLRDDDYQALSVNDKALIANKLNIGNQYHSISYAFQDTFSICSTFYFTNKKNLLYLFNMHLGEMTESLEHLAVMLDILDKDDEE